MSKIHARGDYQITDNISRVVWIAIDSGLTQPTVAVECPHTFEPFGLGVRCVFCDFAPSREQLARYLNTGRMEQPTTCPRTSRRKHESKGSV